MQRSTILRGPAIVTFNGATFWTKGDIKVAINLDSFEVDSSAYGKVDERTTQRRAEVSFEPVGEWENLSQLFPYVSINSAPVAIGIGVSIFTASDLPLVIKTLDGKTITFKAAAITKCPDIILSATKTRWGECTFTCIGSDNTAWTVADSLAAVASVAFSDTSFDPAAIKTEPVTAAWGGSSPWNSFQTAEGFVVSTELGFQNIEIDTDGLVDMTLSKIAVRAKARPVGITEAQLLTALNIQGAGNARGKSLSGADLVITPTTGVITVKGAALHMGGYEFGAATLRIGEVEWVATRTLSVGVVQPLMIVGS